MANTVLNARIILKHATAAEWKDSSLVLLSGELGLDTTNQILKIGDGTHSWRELPSAAGLSRDEAAALIESLGHNHENKAILDQTSAAFTAELQSKLSGLSNYTHPAHTAAESGLYKVTVDALGHIEQTEAVTKEDITALGIPGSAERYGIAGAEAPGLVKSSDAPNQIRVDADGLMSVNSLSADRLLPGTQVLIFDCGSVV